MRYHTVDPRRGPVWQSTADPREALYWMVDDVARSVAWTWARRTPAARMTNDDDVQWLLVAPWLTLITASMPAAEDTNTDFGAEETRSRNSAPQQ